MTVWFLLALSALLLALPVIFRPGTQPPSEFRGLLAFFWYLNAVYCAVVHRLSTERAPLPESGPAILIANHTCNIDNFLLQAGCLRKLGFMISRDYYDVWAFRPFCQLVDCIPVDNNGKNTAATRAALRALKEGRVLPVFPEGRMLTTSGREIGEAKPGVAFIAMKAQVPVIPAYIRGTPESRILWRSFLTPSHSRVLYGDPIDPSEFPMPEGHEAERVALAATTEKLMGAIKALRDRAERRRSRPSGSMNAPWKPVLDRYPASIRPTSPPRPLGNAGGLSGARLWRFDSGRGPLVLRCWPTDGPDLARLEWIHACLAAAR